MKIKITIIIPVFLVCFLVSLLIADMGKKGISLASSNDNISGWGWNSNVGWISFNCTNDNSCSTIDYGVNIDPATGNFSGYAWNSNVGWIDFAPASGYPEAPAYSAKYDIGSGQVTGWAKIVSMGDKGWIKMSGSWDSGTSININTGDFSGWAWNGNTDSDGIGWISFNCLNESCSSSNYKVIGEINQKPVAQSLNAPNWSMENAGNLGALKAFLKWSYNDFENGAESAYQLILNTSNSTSNPIFDSGKCTGYNVPSDKCVIIPGANNFPIHLVYGLNYNTKYYWWAKVWDNYGSNSDLAQYNSLSDTDNNDSDPLTFTTYKHEMPDVNFDIVFPKEPSVGERVKFTDKSFIYTTAHPSTPQACNSGICDYLWTSSDATIENPSSVNPNIIFDKSGSNSVTLKVTDDDGYYDSVTKAFSIKSELPVWREVK